MRVATLALTCLVAFSSTFALAHGYKRTHHHMRGVAAKYDPNGTASGRTTLSGTGSSTYGGNNPGARNSTRQ
jgi:hypothetical protein